MCACTATAACPRCAAADHRDYLVEWEPDERELELSRRYAEQHAQAIEDVPNA